VAFVFLGGVAGVFAFAVAIFAGGTVRRTVVLLGVGLVLTLAWLLGIYFSAPTTDHPGGCSDCGDHFGRWIDATAIFVVVGGNVVAWMLGVVVGSSVRALSNRRAVRGTSSAHPS
jgi:hypothetical protein